jgi:hypothetical protein
MSAALMDKLTGGQTGGGKFALDQNNNVIEVDDDSGLYDTQAEAAAAAAAAKAAAAAAAGGKGGRRHRKSHKGNSWLAHVKATMKLNSGKSFKQVLKIAKKSYKKSQSQSSSQSGGRRKSKGGKGKGTRKGQYGGSGGKVAGVGASASPYV